MGAGPDRYHFAVRFRPGTLSASFLATAPEALRQAVQPLGWDAARDHAPDGTDSLYFLAPAGATLGVDESFQLTVPNLSADGAGGSRGTRVELDFRGLNFEGDPTPVAGSRISYLSVLNRTGRPARPRCTPVSWATATYSTTALRRPISSCGSPTRARIGR